jgi:choline-sulfatase
MYDPADMPLPPEDDMSDMPKHLQNRAEKHSTYAAEEHLRRVKAGYYGMVSLMDEWVGRLLDALEKNGRLNDTVIIFTGDQGQLLGDHGLFGKGLFYRGSIGAPLVVSYPAGFRSGVHVRRPVEMLDLVPTVLQLADAEQEDRKRAMGTDLLPLLTGEGEYGRDVALAEKRKSKMVATDRWKYVEDPRRDRNILFDLKNDPQELHNLAGQDRYADVQKQMQARLKERLSDTTGVKR